MTELTPGVSHEDVFEVAKKQSLQADSTEDLPCVKTITAGLEDRGFSPSHQTVRNKLHDLTDQGQLKQDSYSENGRATHVWGMPDIVDTIDDSIDPLRPQVREALLTYRRRFDYQRDPTVDEVQQFIDRVVNQELIRAVLLDIGDGDTDSWIEPTDAEIDRANLHLKHIVTQSIKVREGWDTYSLIKNLGHPGPEAGQVPEGLRRYAEENQGLLDQFNLSVIQRHQGQPIRVKVAPPREMWNYLGSQFFIDIQPRHLEPVNPDNNQTVK